MKSANSPFETNRNANPLAFVACFAVLGGVFLLTSNPASAQKPKPKTLNAPPSLVIYQGEALKSTGMSLATWGSGQIEESAAEVYGGAASLRIMTQGLYQGATISLMKPANLSPYLASKYAYLQFAVMLQDESATGAAKGGSPAQNGVPAQYAQFANRFGGAGGAKGGAGSGAARQSFDKEKKIESLRIVLTTVGGKKHELLLDLKNSVEDKGWKVLSVPVSKIPGLSDTDAQVSDVQFFGNASGTFYLGGMSVSEDSAPITLDDIGDKNAIERLSLYTYRALAHAGTTPLVYSWDWDASDGIQEEAEGKAVLHGYRTSSVDAGSSKPYVVTVTVKDLYGIKAPVKTSFKVFVTL